MHGTLCSGDNGQLQTFLFILLGAYDEAIGTNMFFEEVEDPPLKTNLFEKDTPIQLRPTLTQTKLLRLKQVKLPRNVTAGNKQSKENIHLNLNQDYKILLDKLQHNLVELDELAHKIENKENDNEDETVYEERREDDTFLGPAKEIDTYLGTLNNKSSNALLEAKYEKLKRLARRPVHRIQEAEEVEECDLQYKNAFEYHNLERQICQSSDYFRTVSGAVIDQSFTGGIDLDRCILHGLIRGDDNANRILTKEEQSKVFSLTNLENLSIPMRYLLLKQCISNIENLIETTSFEQLHERDKDGKTIIDICNIFRRLVSALEDVMATEKHLTVKIKKRLDDRDEDEYIKYRYDHKKEILRDFYKEHFNTKEWEDMSKAEEKVEQDLEEDSDYMDSSF